MAFNPPTWLVFIGTIFVLAGAFLILTGTQIVGVNTILVVSPGRKTWGAGLVVLVVGVALLLLEIGQPQPESNAGSSRLQTPEATAESQATIPTAGSAASVEIVRIVYEPATSALDEYVELRNQSAEALDMAGWSLVDHQEHVYRFADFVLEPGAAVKVWTGSGRDSATDLYWGFGTSVWNDGGDEATLLDADGVEVARFSYMD